MASAFAYGLTPKISAAAPTALWAPERQPSICRGVTAPAAFTADSADEWVHRLLPMPSSDPVAPTTCQREDSPEPHSPDTPNSRLSGSVAPNPTCTHRIHKPAAAPAAAAPPGPDPALARRGAKAPHCDPCWAAAITDVHFFAPCARHATAQKNECHFYCVGCTPSTKQPMCQHCLSAHAERCSGACFQVYRYMYNDVIRYADFGRLHPMSDVQAYRANGHAAVHLRPREMPKTKSPAGFTSRCGGCARSLSPEWTYCSLACKLGVEGCDSAVMCATGGKQQADCPASVAARMASQCFEPRQRAAASSDDDECNCVAVVEPLPRCRPARPAPAEATAISGAKRRKLAQPQRSASE